MIHLTEESLFNQAYSTKIMAKKKEPKKRPDKYDEKLHVKGSFEDLIKIAVSDKPNESDKSDKEGK